MEILRTVQRPLSFSGELGYIIYEPFVEDQFGVIKVLIRRQHTTGDDVERGYLMDFHLVRLNETADFDSFGHHITIGEDTITMDDEVLEQTTRVPSPVRTAFDDGEYEPQSNGQQLQRFRELTN